MVVHACHPKLSSFRHFFNKKKNTNIYQNFKWFINKNSFILKTIYFCFKNTFVLQMIYRWKRFRFKKNCTFVSKTLWLCKWFIIEKVFVFILKNFFRFKRNFFRVGNTSTFFSKTFSFCKKKVNQNHFENKSHQIFWSLPMRATLRWGPVFPLEKAYFADSPMSMSGSSRQLAIALQVRLN